MQEQDPASAITDSFDVSRRRNTSGSAMLAQLAQDEGVGGRTGSALGTRLARPPRQDRLREPSRLDLSVSRDDGEASAGMVGEVSQVEGGSTEVARPTPLVGLLSYLGALRARFGVAPAMIKGAGWSIGGTASGAMVSFVVQVILARALQPTGYGVYSYLLAWVNVAALIGKLEFDTAAIRFVAAYDGQRQDGLLRGFWLYGFRLVSRTATGVALLGGVAAWLLRRSLHPGIEGGIWAASVLVPVTALLAYSSSTLQGFRRVPQAQLPQQVLRPVLFGIGVVLVTVGLGAQLAAGQAVALNAAATAVALGSASSCSAALPRPRPWPPRPSS